MKAYILALLGFCCISAALSMSVKKGCNEKFKGCKLVKGDCVCGTELDCKSPWPYVSIKECERDLRGENDRCRKQPCWHGKCVQVLLDDKKPVRKWACSCAGSGFYGKKCQYRCPPSDKDAPLPFNYPRDCIY